jgi:cytochrome c
MRACEPDTLGLVAHIARKALPAGLVLFTCIAAGAPAHASKYGIGSVATPAQIESWNIDVSPDGKRLPPGLGLIPAGRKLYEAKCAACHGAAGEGGVGDRLVGGAGTLTSKKPIKTVGSFWPYATTLFDYIRRAMPLNAPQTLSNDEVYAVTGYVLSMNGLWPGETPVSAASLLKVKMPNHDGFVGDPRPDAP